jgi:hypothetical protein
MMFLMPAAICSGSSRWCRDHRLPIMSTTALGLMPSNSPFLTAPQDVLGAVAADAEVRGLVLAELLLEDGLLAVPAGGDGVAEEDDLRFALLGDGDEGFVRLEEVGLGLAVGAELRSLPRCRWLGRQLHGRARRPSSGVSSSASWATTEAAEQGEPEEEGQGANSMGCGGLTSR